MEIVQCDWCPYKKDLRTHRPQGSKCAWAARRRGAPGSQGERPQKKPTLLTPLSWVHGLRNSEEIGFCGLHHQPGIFCHGSFSGVNPHPRHRAVCITPVLYLCTLPPQPFLCCCYTLMNCCSARPAFAQPELTELLKCWSFKTSLWGLQT